MLFIIEFIIYSLEEIINESLVSTIFERFNLMAEKIKKLWNQQIKETKIELI